MKKKTYPFKSAVHQLRNGEHYNMNKNIAKQVESELAKADITPLTVLGTAYIGHVKHEELVLKHENVAPETELLQEANSRRHEALNTIEIAIMTQAEHGYIPAMQEAAASLVHIIHNYRGTKYKSQTDETGLLDNMLEDLDKPESKSALAVLGLQPTVEKLRTANVDFDTLWHSRAHNEAHKRGHGTAKESRDRTDDSLEELLFKIEAVYNSDMTGTYVHGVLGDLIDFINEEFAAGIEVLSRHRNIMYKPHKPSPGDDPDGGVVSPEDGDDGGIGK